MPNVTLVDENQVPVFGAVGSTASGGVLKTGGVFASNPTAIAVGQVATSWVNPQGATIIAAINAPANDSLSNTQVGISAHDSGGTIYGMLLVAPRVFNGTTWDRQRGDANGLVTQPALSSTFWNYAAATGGITNSTVGVTAKAAAGAGNRNYTKSLQLTADALGAATEFVIRDGAGGTVMARVKVNTGGIAGSGTTIFDPPLRGTANTLVEIQTLTASVTGGVFANLQGYTGV